MSRHAKRRPPRAHWVLLLLVLSAMSAALLFEGWTTHEVASAPTKPACDRPIPKTADDGDPVVRITDDRIETLDVPAGTAVLTYDGGPSRKWTPRLLDLLREHDARATFFLLGVEAVRHPDLVRRIRDEGHEIGSFTHTGADLGAVSPPRERIELSLAQTALAGTAGVRTNLLRLPNTTQVDTICGAEWEAARRAAADGYLLVGADGPDKPPAAGLVRQHSHSQAGYEQSKKLLEHPEVHTFTTLTDALGMPPGTTPAATAEQWQGTALVWAQRVGHAFVHAMAWVLAVAGALTALRLVLLILFARAHVRRRERRGPRPPRRSAVTDPVTVLVPAYNEEAGIEATLRSLLDSTHPFLEVIVIDDGSTDRTPRIAEEVAASDPRVRVIRQANGGKAAALNRGLAMARYDIVVMVDADTVFEPDTIHRLIQPMAHPQTGAVSGNTKVGNRRRLLGRWQHLEYVFGFNLDRRMFDVLRCMPTVPGAIGAFRREAVREVGGVSGDTLAEDTDLTMALWRAGWQVEYEETAIAWTEVPCTLRQLWRQRYRWSYGTMQAMWKHRACLRQTGSAGRFGRRALSYLTLFQVALPLLAPVVDVFALYGLLFRSPVEAMGVWLAFLAVQLVGAGYALRLDGERLRTLWTMPAQVLVYRQLMYLVIIQSLVTAVLGTRLAWHRIQRSGTATAQIAVARPAAWPATVDAWEPERVNEAHGHRGS